MIYKHFSIFIRVISCHPCGLLQLSHTQSLMRPWGLPQALRLHEWPPVGSCTADSLTVLTGALLAYHLVVVREHFPLRLFPGRAFPALLTVCKICINLEFQACIMVSLCCVCLKLINDRTSLGSFSREFSLGVHMLTSKAAQPPLSGRQLRCPTEA